MPKYKIREVDNTGVPVTREQPNIVYIPGAANAGVGPTLCKTLAELTAMTGLKDDNSYKLAKKLLGLGMQVVYQGFKEESDGTISISAADWKALEDKNLYNVRFLTTGAYACPSADMIICAANRGDCIALVDHSAVAEGQSYNVTSIRKEIEDLADEVKNSETPCYANDPCSFASAFTPWFGAEGSFEGDVPASFGYLLAYARAVKQNPLWKAIAGVFRGVIPELTSVQHKLTSAECDALGCRAAELDGDGDNQGIAINPIACKRYSGFNGGMNYVIDGNRTMHKNTAQDGTIATSFLNVRALITEISKVLYDTSVKYTFEQNDNVLWINFKSDVSPLLDKMQTGEGIEGYRLERVATDRKARLCARLIIVPIEAVEDFELTIYLNNSLDENVVTIVG